jgi:hypothetical protein
MLYLYTSVEPDNYGKRPHVLRTSNTLFGKAPDYEASHCVPFNGCEIRLLREILIMKDYLGVGVNYRGWLRFPDYAVEQLIVGCVACDIELEVIDWTG